VSAFVIDGAAWAGWGNALAQCLEGDTPDALVPVLGGESIPFVSDSEREYADAKEATLVVQRTKTVFVRAVVPKVGDRYTFNDITWQVASSEPDRAAGADWPCRVTLVAEASDALQVPT